MANGPQIDNPLPPVKGGAEEEVQVNWETFKAAVDLYWFAKTDETRAAALEAFGRFEPAFSRWCTSTEKNPRRGH